MRAGNGPALACGGVAVCVVWLTEPLILVWDKTMQLALCIATSAIGCTLRITNTCYTGAPPWLRSIHTFPMHDMYIWFPSCLTVSRDVSYWQMYAFYILTHSKYSSNCYLTLTRRRTASTSEQEKLVGRAGPAHLTCTISFVTVPGLQCP